MRKLRLREVTESWSKLCYAHTYIHTHTHGDTQNQRNALKCMQNAVGTVKIICFLPSQRVFSGETFVSNMTITWAKRQPRGDLKGEAEGIKEGFSEENLVNWVFEKKHQEEKSCDSRVGQNTKCFVYIITFYSFNLNNSNYSCSQFYQTLKKRHSPDVLVHI